MRTRLLISSVTATSLIAMSVVVIGPAQAAVTLDTPDQAATDQSASNEMQNGLWGDFAGGVDSRPYVQRLSVINGDIETEVVTGGTPTDAPPTSGDLTAVVAPVNLCKTGVTLNCYATPNRVSITLGNQGSGVVNTDLSNVTNQTINANTVIDMTVRLNTLGQSLRWSHANGDLLFWQPSGLGTPDAAVRIKFHPATTPAVDWQNVGDNGCTATPIFNCDIAQADADYLGASLLLSLDTTLGADLTGAVFGTTSALFGYASLSGSASAPVMDYQLASTHRDSDGVVNSGTLKAFLPAAALVNLYGLLPEDAAATLAVARTGSTGTNDTPTFTRWTAGTNGADGVLANVAGITFSAPKYKLSRTAKPVSSSATVKTVTVGTKKRKKKVAQAQFLVVGTPATGGAMAQCPKTQCTVTVRRITKRNSAATTPVFSVRTKATSVKAAVAAALAPKGSRYLVKVSPLSGSQRGKVVGSGLGTVR